MDPSDERPFRLTSSLILESNSIAIQGIETFAGTYRNGPVDINESKHSPPKSFLIPDLVTELCDYVNKHFRSSSALHLAAYIMWRLNWIHPFFDGNGRTSRVISYLVMCIKLQLLIPGSKTMPELISENRNPYYDALEKADEKSTIDCPNVHDMEDFLGNLLIQQLGSVDIKDSHFI